MNRNKIACIQKNNPFRSTPQQLSETGFGNSHSKIEFLLSKLFTTEGHKKAAFEDKYLSFNGFSHFCFTSSPMPLVSVGEACVRGFQRETPAVIPEGVARVREGEKTPIKHHE